MSAYNVNLAAPTYDHAGNVNHSLSPMSWCFADGPRYLLAFGTSIESLCQSHAKSTLLFCCASVLNLTMFLAVFATTSTKCLGHLASKKEIKMKSGRLQGCHYAIGDDGNM